MLKIINNETMEEITVDEIKTGMILRISGDSKKINLLLFEFKHVRLISEEVAAGFETENGEKTVYIKILPLSKNSISAKFVKKEEEKKDLIYRITVKCEDRETSEIICDRLEREMSLLLQGYYNEIYVCNDFEHDGEEMIIEVISKFEYGHMDEFRHEMINAYKLAKKVVTY